MIVQILSWIAVAWLLVVHLLVERSRLPRGGRAIRFAGGVAAASLIAAAVVTGFYPIAALGLLWLRTEVLAQPQESDAPEHPWVAMWTAIGRVTQPFLTIVLRIEIVTIVVVALLFFGHWAKQNTADFNRRADHVVCGLLHNRC